MEVSMTKVDMRGVRQRLIGEGIHKEDVGEWLVREDIIKYLNTSNSAFYRRVKKGILPRATWYKSRKCWNTVQCDRAFAEYSANQAKQRAVKDRRILT